MEEEEQKLVQDMLKKFAQDEEMERHLLMQKMEAKDRFVELAKKQREERARLYLDEREREEAEAKASMAEEEYRQRIIAEARRRLLEQHAKHLKGFLPKMDAGTGGSGAKEK